MSRYDLYASLDKLMIDSVKLICINEKKFKVQLIFAYLVKNEYTIVLNILLSYQKV